MAISHATDQNFASEISEGVVLVDFWAPWCGPCKMIAPVLEELDGELNGKAKIVKLDVDDNQETAGKYGVMSIPTLIVFKDGKEVDKTVGFQPKEALQELINKPYLMN
ncbi:thioredoxin [Lederbergia galactosidilytica]|uniref:Thioredoxin n=1 Tax=Lederbergia galactosidilytica TaxID=217031 RepID=A0A0Q9Y3R1_9BACI|nr:thioredoxin [Lederbergia galactosidilytica]